MVWTWTCWLAAMSTERRGCGGTARVDVLARGGPCVGCVVLVAGTGFEPADLQVMSLTSYRAAPPRATKVHLGHENASTERGGAAL